MCTTSPATRPVVWRAMRVVGCVLLPALLWGPGARGAGPDLVDPTRPLVVTTGPETGGIGRPKLTSVLIGKQRRLAVINSQLVSEGDLVAGYTVRSIESGGVLVSIGNERPFRLTLDVVNIDKDQR